MSKKKASAIPIELKGVFLLLGSLLAFLALVSFRQKEPSHNWLGLAGHALAFGLEYLFGLSSFLLLLFVGWTGLRLIKQKEISHYKMRTLYFALILLSLCVQLNLIGETFPSFANFFAPLIYTQTITLYQKTRYNLGGAPFYYLYRDMPLLNLQRLLSDLGVGIIFFTTFLISFLQLTKWRLAFFVLKFFKKEKKEEKPSWFAFFLNRSKKKGFLDTIINVPHLPFDAAPPTFSPLRRTQVELTPSFSKKKPPSAAKKPAPDSSHYTLPSLDLLTDVKVQDNSVLKKDLTRQAEILEETLLSFGIEAKVGQIYCGPTITSFEVHPAIGVKVQKIKTLENDIALNLQARSIRIIAPIPGKACVGVEIPSPKPQEVSFKELIGSYLHGNQHFAIPIVLGKSVTGEDVIADLSKMPHCIIAGATGSGKSVCINTVVMSILMSASPDEIKLLMIDPKKVELTAYSELPHLIAPVITDASSAAAALNWLVKEMERRYELLKQVGARNIASFNSRPKNGDEEEGTPATLPYIVGIVDELADLMMVASQDIETPIARIAQMARAVGIHLILATQRPSREVITGLIKANFPTRIAFKVASRVNSQIILDDVGAEALLGNGDMLFLPPGSSTLIRTQGAFIRDEDINKVIQEISSCHPPCYLIQSFAHQKMICEEEEPSLDTLYGEAKSIVQQTKNASTTFLQRKLKIGYARAASLIDQLELHGIIGPQEGSKPRKVLIVKDLRERPLEPIEDVEF